MPRDGGNPGMDSAAFFTLKGIVLCKRNTVTGGKKEGKPEEGNKNLPSLYKLPMTKIQFCQTC